MQLNFVNIITINIETGKEEEKFIKKYFPGIEKYNEVKNLYILKILYDENIEKYSTEFEEKEIKMFAGSYYKRHKNKEQIYYAVGDDRASEHLVKINENKIYIYLKDKKDKKIIISIIRELILHTLLRDGYRPLHASAINDGEYLKLFTGASGKGKSTSFFSEVIYKNAMPVTGDISWVKPDDGKLKIIGFPWTLTIGEGYIKEISEKKITKYNIAKNGKIKFYPDDFCEEFDTVWCWEGIVNEIILVDLNIMTEFNIEKMSEINMYETLNLYGHEEWWEFNDIFNLSMYLKIEDIDYNKVLNCELKYKKYSGNILKNYDTEYQKITGISDEIGINLNDQIETLKNLKINNMELRKIEHKNLHKFTIQELEEINRKFLLNNIRITCIDTPIGKNKLAFNQDENLELFVKYIKISKIFNVNKIRVFSDISKNIEVFEKLDKLGKENEINILFETEKDTDILKNTQFLKKIEQYNHLNILMDIDNLYKSNIDPINYLRKNYKKINHIHISDFKDNKYRILGEGDYDVFNFLKELKKLNINPSISIESKFKEEEAKYKKEIFKLNINKLRKE